MEDSESERLDINDFLRRILLSAEEARKEDLSLLLDGVARSAFFVRDKVVTIFQEIDKYCLEVRDARRSPYSNRIVFQYSINGDYQSFFNSGDLSRKDLDGPILDSKLDFSLIDTPPEVPIPKEALGDSWILKTRQEGIALDDE
jgi:hypothetical protein